MEIASLKVERLGIRTIEETKVIEIFLDVIHLPLFFRLGMFIRSVSPNIFGVLLPAEDVPRTIMQLLGENTELYAIDRGDAQLLANIIGRPIDVVVINEDVVSKFVPQVLN